MDALDLRTNVGLASTFGVAAVLFGLLAFRAGALADTLDQIAYLRARNDVGYGRGFWRPLLLARVAQLIILIIAAVGSAVFVWQLWSYLAYLKALVPVRAMDAAVVALVSDFADQWSRSTLRSGFVLSALLLVEYVLAVALHRLSIVAGEPPIVFEHPTTIPRSWRDGAEAMWETHADVVIETMPQDTELRQIQSGGTWRDQWPDWATLAVTYGHLAARTSCRNLTRSLRQSKVASTGSAPQAALAGERGPS